MQENKHISTGLAIAACALSLAANADTFWKGQGADSDFYNRDNWMNWWDANYVFGGDQLGNLPADGSYVTFTNAAAIAQGLSIENANKGGVEWSLAENAEEGAGLTITNSLTIGTGKAGQLTIKGGEYLVRGALNVASGLGTDNDGPGKSTLTLTNCTMTVGDGVFVAYNANGADGEIVVQSNAVLNATNTSDDKFSICKGGNGHNDTKGSLVIDGGTVNVAGPLYTCQDSGTGNITINGGELNAAKSFLMARSYYTGSYSSSTLSMNGGAMTVGGEMQIGGTQTGSTAAFAKIEMTGGTIEAKDWTSIGRYGRGILELKGGTFKATVKGTEIARYNNSTGTVIVAGGEFRQEASDVYVGKQGACGELVVSSGTFYAQNKLYISDQSTTEGHVLVTGGSAEVRGNIVVGNNGTGSFYMNGGEVYIGDQFWLGNGGSSYGLFVMTNGEMTVNSYTCVGYGSGNGKFIMNGGSYYQNSEKFIIGQGGSGTAYGECIVSNGTINVPNLWVAEKATPGMLTMEGGEFISRGETQMSRNSGAGKGTIILNGGTLSVSHFVSSSGTGGEVTFNGGTLKALDDRGDFIPDIANCEFKIAEGGVVFDTNGKNVTIADTLENADGLEGNGMIWKKGLGTLTISSDLDLVRTFKFTIDTDLGEAGVGPIALTGTNNTLAAGKKITVDVRPENLITETYYPLITGLTNEITMASIEITGDSFFVYTGKIENGTLSVSASLREGAPAKARYVDNAWKFYDNDGNALPAETEESIHTYYVFTGAEPVADLLAKASTNKIMLEAAKSGGNAVTNTIAIPSDFAPKYLAIETEEGCAVALSGDFVFTPVKFANRGTLIFAGEITLSGIVDYPFSIADGALVTLVTPQTIGGEISGTGTLALTGGTYGYLKTDETTVLDGFEGTLVVRAGAQFDTQYNRRGNPDKFHIMLGKARVRLEGATMTVPADNEAYIYNEIEIKTGTVNVISGTITALCIDGKLTGGGTVTLRCPSNRGGRIRGDSSEFSGTCIIENVFGANGGDEGIQGANAGSASATWVFPADGVCSESYKKTYLLNAQDATMYLGAFQQTGPKAYVNVGTSGTTVQVGDLSKGESVIEGQFTNNPLTLKKVGADSWLTLGTNFGMVANSTLTVSAGGLAFNLPTDDAVTDLTGDTVTIDPSVKIRVAMTQEQYEALDLNEEYVVAKLPTNPGYKPETELLVDGTVLDTSAAAKWGVRFKSFPAVGETPAYIGAVLCRKTTGLIIMFR